MRDECRSSYHVESGDAKDLRGVVYSVFLQSLDCDWKGAVHRVRDDEYECVWACRSDIGGKVTDYACVDLKEICRRIK